MAEAPASVDAYLAGFPDDVRARLQELRELIHEVVPDVGETISYQIPTFTRGGRYLVYLAGWKQHIALYPVPADCGDLEAEVAPLRDARATLKFVHRKALPVDLVRRLLPLLVAAADARA